ncbi:hypothetical protein bcCo53_001256 (plasmid) [Borrelia coriaceae]|uniref:Uncharacterized protein n=1 Tax=Borrelia coriaceae ATCC 43381 TaxID=1408429 RepID=W5SWA1_9SPIR|nr:hypothetical protein [Borrelia coriaceae]AHH11210.1 hypothetical protein BCO_0900045 [Borrelia coriaceae ATCC 43381]UPA17087.1 hypothetical protein bcCo53_001256 [Borrelia coriaceae]
MIGKYTNALNALLVLLLLMLMLPVISCDSKRDPHVGGRKPPGTSTLIRNRRREPVNGVVGFNVLKGGTTDVIHTETPNKRPKKAPIIEERISRLVHSLGLPDHDVSLIIYVLDVLTDDRDLMSIGAEVRDEISSLEQLESAKSNDLRGMIDTVRAVLVAKTEADGAINGVSQPELKKSFRDDLNRRELQFKRELKLQVGPLSWPEDFLAKLDLLKKSYMDDFASIKSQASNANRNIEDLDGTIGKVLRSIRDIVTKPNDGGPNLPVLSDVSFDIFWKRLNAHQLSEVVALCHEIESIILGMPVVVNQVNEKISLKELNGLFDRVRNELYPIGLKKLCSNFINFEYYKNELAESKAKFNGVLNIFKAVVSGETIYRELRDDDRRLIDDVRDFIVNVKYDVYDDPDKPFKFHYEYDFLLGFYGLEVMKKLRTDALREFFDVRKQAQIAVASVSDSEKRQKLEGRLKDLEPRAVSFMRKAVERGSTYFDSLENTNNMIANISNEDVVKEFLAIKTEAADKGY